MKKMYMLSAMLLLILCLLGYNEYVDYHASKKMHTHAEELITRSVVKRDLRKLSKKKNLSYHEKCMEDVLLAYVVSYHDRSYFTEFDSIYPILRE